MDNPKLRNVNVFPVQMSGKTHICLQDPYNISEKALFLSPPLYFIISRFDGTHSILDIQTDYMRTYGELLFSEKIEEVMSQLDENLFLEGDRFEAAFRGKRESFRKATQREAVFAGKSYAEEPNLLRKELEGYFSHADGPGAPGPRADKNQLKGVVAPHIDFQRGGPCYAFAHREVWERSSPDCFIVLGTAHAMMNHPFCVTRKSFSTPLGNLEVDGEIVRGLQSRCPYDLYEDEWTHRGEHSIEFQCVFLRFLFPESAPIRIVPILCGSLHEAIERRISPMELKPVRQFIEALKEVVSVRGKQICYIASADLSHMGPQFGDREGMSEYDLRVLSEEDQALLTYVQKADSEGFFEFIAKDQDRRRVCGVPAIYALLQLLKPKEGRLLKYGQAFTQESQSVVSFASLAFY
jgi:AmmeMemoRadiSam system protein B